MKRLVGGVLVAAMLFTSSAVLSAEDKMAETPYFPLNVGATWHYKAGEAKITFRVAKHEKVGDTLCARIEVMRDGKMVGSQHLAVTAEGVYCHDRTFLAPTEDAASKDKEHFVTRTPKPPTLLLKLPPKKDSSWKVDSKEEDGRAYRGEFRIDEQEVKVPAGTFKTIRVSSRDLEANGLNPLITTYYASGIGMVKQVIQVGNAMATIELEKFESGK